MIQPLCRRPAAFGAACAVLCSLIAAPVAMAASTPSTPPLEEVLRRTGKAVEAFEQEFSAINCTEQVSQVKLGPAGKPLFHQESAFDYLVMVHSAPDNLTVEESRQEVKSTGEVKKKLPLLVTDGFSTLLLIFHPFFQDSFEYAPPEADELNGRKVLRVRFRQIHGARALSELQLRGHDFPLEWQGTAWIDARSNVILRITAGLDARAIELVSWQLKKKSGPFAYVIAGFQALAERQPSISVLADGQNISGELVLIGNGKLYGGRFEIFPAAEYTNGLLDACVFPRVNLWTLLRCAPGFLLRHRLPEKFVQRLRAEKFELTSKTAAATTTTSETNCCQSMLATYPQTRFAQQLIGPGIVMFFALCLAKCENR